MKAKGIQVVSHTDDGDIMDLKVQIVRDPWGKILSGLVIGNTLEQNKAFILIANTGDFKFAPTLGVGIEDMLLGEDLLAYRHKIRSEFKKDGLKITELDLYHIDQLKIDAHYE